MNLRLKFAGSLFLIGLLFVGCSKKDPVKQVHIQNGATVLLSQYPSSISSAAVLLPFGSVDGPDYLAALTANALLRGSEIRTGQQLYEEIELLGGRIHVETELTQTLVWIQAPEDNFNACFRLLCEAISKPAFDQPEIVMVYQQLLKESAKDYNAYWKANSWIDDRVRHDLFGNSQLGRPRFKKSQLYDREQVLDFYQNHVHADEMIFALAGTFNKADVMAVIESSFEEQSGKLEVRSAVNPEKMNCISEEIYHDPSELAQVYLALRAPGRLKHGYVEMHILRNALSLNLPLWRRSMQLPSNPKHSIQLNVMYQSGDTYGYFFLGANRYSQDIEETRQTLLRFVEHLQKNGMPEEIFTIAKRHLIFELMYGEQFSLNKAIHMALYYGIEESWQWNLDEALESIENVTLDEMNQILKDTLQHPCVIMNLPQ